MDAETLAAIYKESAQRSKENNIISNSNILPKRLTDKELENVSAVNAELLEHAIPVIHHLFNTFERQQKLFTILTDSEGAVLHISGDTSLLFAVDQINLKSGTVLSEQYAGTNAVALALIHKHIFFVKGCQNYIEALKSLDMACAPVINYNNRLSGTISIATENGNLNPGIQALVAMTAHVIADRIWNNLIQKQLNNERQYAFNIINNLTYGLFAINLEQKIYWVNDTACRAINIRRTHLLNRDMIDFLPDWEIIRQELDSDKIITDEEHDLVFSNSQEKYIINAYSIKGLGSQLLGYVITIRPFSRMMKIIGRYSSSNAFFSFKDILGQSEAMKYAVNMAKTAARSPSTILITGSSGTGKEVFAQAIHNASNRKNNNFIAINCGAISSTLIESELFGYEEGAFTGALRKGKPGKFELADNGTIFLDEIGDMPHEMQVKLLRAIQEKKITKVGGSREIPIDVRIIAATNKDLPLEIKKGSFRTDLYYRLSVVPIHLPSLQHRTDDIPLLIRFFLKQKSQLLNRPIPEIDKGTLQHLLNYSWPGNVRELENTIEKIVLFYGQQEIKNLLPDNAISNPPGHVKSNNHETLPVEPLMNVEKQAIENALQQTGWNIAATAKALGIGRNTLYEKIKKHHIVRLNFTKSV
ncbi:MAG: sigma 54-interacting transcriptional regulator [Bacteroidales bacterium]|nr:sigma 54-interacting transcriptional regulator [Bacteroidales bacterium]